MSLTHFFRSLLTILSALSITLMIYASTPLITTAAEAVVTSDNLMSTGFTFKASDFLGGVSTDKITLTSGTDGKTTEGNLQSFGGSIAKTLLNILVLATAAMTVVAGILMVTSYGNSEKAEKAKSILTTCATALILALFANAMIRVILLLLAA